MTRGRAFLVALALILCVLAGSPSRIVGDGGEYMAMTLNLAAGRRPALASAEIPGLQARIGEIDPILANWDMKESSFAGRDGRRDFLHFWFYPLAVVPAMRLVQAIHVTPVAAFTITNIALFLLALWIALPRVNHPTLLLLFGSPIVWWLDKPHSEVFTFSLLTMAFVFMEERPWWAAIAAGAAAAQNTPIACIFALIAIGAPLFRRALLRDWRFLIGLAGGVALAALQPVYTYVRHGTPTLLLKANPNHVPSIAELIAVPFDPVVGLLPNFPALLLLTALAAIVVVARRAREAVRLDLFVAVIAAPVLIFSFAQATNVHHGATPSLSRYAIWLFPLAIPLLRQAWRIGSAFWNGVSWTVAVCSAVMCVFVFHPRVPQNGREPTWLASALWNRHPGWNNPLPEVFAETVLEREARWVPVATRGCDKILFMGRSDGSAFPIPCFPAPVPPMCASAGALCYANRVGDHYEFVRAPGSPIQLEGFVYQKDWVWPENAIAHARDLLTQFKWWTLKPKENGDELLRLTRDVHALELDGGGRSLFVLRDAGADAQITLQPPSKMTGVLADAMTGETIQTLAYNDTPSGWWDVKLPARRLLLLSLWRS